jgi:multidrug efflux pump subunit AcrA (membrane-fusion protein)
MLATARIILPKINNSFGVPVSSVLSDNGKKYVFIANNKKLQKKEIKILTRFDEIYVINGDVKSNDILVTKDVSSLSEGQDVLTSRK